MPGNVLRAPAKLNLFLHILGRRPDGYHLLESLVAFTELSDTLSIEQAPTLTLTTTGEFASNADNNDDNLVMRAAKALQAATGETQGAKLTLTKNIPVGAGLGGGSADAAAALNGLNTHWQLRLPPAELHKIAVTLGADVAMCLDPKPALVQGIGEIVAPLTTSLLPMFVVLVHPRAPLLTKDVYGMMQSLPAPIAFQFPQVDLLAHLRQYTRNHLQPAAIEVNPLVAEVLLALETSQPEPSLARMTGSGACCFAVYPSEQQATQAAAAITRDYPSWWVRATAVAVA